MCEIEDKLNKLQEYIDYYTERRVNEELIDLNNYILEFDEWYKLGNQFERNKVIAGNGRRRTGRTHAMIMNIIQTIVDNKYTSHNLYICIDVVNLSHGKQIIGELANYLKLENKNGRFIVKSVPHITIEAKPYKSEDYRGRTNTIHFEDHYVIDKSIEDNWEYHQRAVKRMNKENEDFFRY